MPATPPPRPSRRWPRRRWPRRSARGSRRGAHARWRAAHSRRPATPSAPRLSSSAPRASFEACGALGYRDEAERDLRRLGRRRVRRRDGAGIGSLSERELEVARLIVDRRTNPQIAAALFLSPKTVESHVRSLFHKLGVGSRAEIARVLEQADRS